MTTRKCRVETCASVGAAGASVGAAGASVGAAGVFAALAGLVFATTSCAIGADDPLPNIGAPCKVAEGKCDVEHVCKPDAVGADSGLCVPIASFGACDAKLAVTHQPGRKGKDSDKTVIEINGVEDVAFIQDVRSIHNGQVRTFLQGTDNVDVPDLCDFRQLQEVGVGLAISDTDQVTALDGLQSVTSVRGGLAIFDNLELVDVSALANLVDITPHDGDNARFDVLIAGNPKLDTSAVSALIDALNGRVGRELDVVACKNHAPPPAVDNCSGGDDDLLTTLITQGFGG